MSQNNFVFCPKLSNLSCQREEWCVLLGQVKQLLQDSQESTQFTKSQMSWFGYLVYAVYTTRIPD